MMPFLAVTVVALAAMLSLAQSSAALDLANDTSNCGRVGRICAPKDNGKVYCDAGTCRVNCNEGWIQANNLCKETKQHRKLRLSKPVSLCPSGESACPIQGAKSFIDFPSAERSSEGFLYALSARPGGFECLDVTTSLESCGGCTSTGQGRDCTQIQNAEGVGCSGGQCHILSCQSGYALSTDGQECHQRARKLTHGHRHKKVK